MDKYDFNAANYVIESDVFFYTWLDDIDTITHWYGVVVILIERRCEGQWEWILS